MTDMTLGQRIAQRRKMLSLSQEAFGEKMGVSRQAASKWEADAAVPEIEKLINMSKLFGVSVGWLLGVEDSEAPAADDQTELTEQILMTFRPPEPETPEETELPPPAAIEPVSAKPKRQSGRRWLTATCAVVAAVSIFINVFSMIRYDRVTKEAAAAAEAQEASLSEMHDTIISLETQVKQLDSTMDYYSVTARSLSKLETTVQELMELYGTGTEIPTPTPLPTYDNLSKWSLTGRSTAELSKVELLFDAAASTDISAARIIVSQSGKQILSQDCYVAKRSISAKLTVPTADGYEYRLLLTHWDDTVQSITLEGHGLSDLTALAMPILRSTPREVNVFSERFSQGWFNIYLALPYLMDCDPYEMSGFPYQYKWSDLRISYYMNDMYVSDSPLDSQLSTSYEGAPYISFSPSTVTIEFPDFKEDDTHALYLEGTLTIDGVANEFSMPLREWVVRNGTFVNISE